MQLLLQNCTNMDPFKQVLYNLVFAISCFHTTVYQSFALNLNAILSSFRETVKEKV